jgi:hypothetical protein
MIHYLTTRKDPVPNFSTFAYGQPRDSVRVEGYKGGISEEGEAGKDTGGVIRAIDAPEVQKPIQRGYEADESFAEKLTSNAM